MGASVLHTGEGGKFGCLLRLEPNYGTQVRLPLLLQTESYTNHYMQMVRLTIRATDESVPPIMIKLMEERLAVGISTAPEVVEAPTYRDISDAFGNVLVE